MPSSAEVDPTKRFTGRAEAYSKFRPQYPLQILRFLEEEIAFNSEETVVDFGSGTGILTKLFLDNGNKVHGVEPNGEMRSLAEENLAAYPRFISVKGTAEESTLEKGIANLVAVGQALHWFNIERAREEFGRVLQNGHVVVVYNDRLKDKDEFMMEYEKVMARYTMAFRPDSSKNGVVADLFGRSEYKTFKIPNDQFLDFDERKSDLGFLLSEVE